MKFQTLVLNDKIVGGKKVSKKLRFTDKTYNTPTPTYPELMDHSLDLLDEEERNGGTTMIYDINPAVFRERKFLVKIDPDFLKDKSDSVEKALNLEAYDRLIQSPIIAQDRESQLAVTQDFLIEQFAPGNSDKYMPKEQPVAPVGMEEMQDSVQAGTTNQFSQKGVNTNFTQQLTGSTSPKKLLSK